MRLVNRRFPETRRKTVEISAEMDGSDFVEAWSCFAESEDAASIEKYHRPCCVVATPKSEDDTNEGIVSPSTLQRG
uniref:Uncharacterized protein n=1 Tax=Mycena chlorophos TaxID=658473 RepID=A0ABQ0L5G1_MYCCL|nr:predicted protein [Mycena chlorophos]